MTSHPTPALHGFQSNISMPIRLSDGSFFGTLCAIDPDPHSLNAPDTIAMFEMFADVIGHHLSTVDRMNRNEATRARRPFQARLETGSQSTSPPSTCSNCPVM